VVRAREPHHLKGESSLTEIVWRTEPNRQIDLPKGLDALARLDAVGVVLGCSWSNPIPISRRVCTYMMLRLLPPSISTLENRELPMTGPTTSGYWSVLGMRFG
jgi:hypothetical protein